jgi:GNAT superfamily N-acetyltransferase
VPQPSDVLIRDLRPADQGAAIDVFVESFLDFPALQVLVGTGEGARDRLRRMFAMEFEPESRLRAIVAELDGRVVGALTYGDTPACSAMSAGRMVRFMRIAGTRIFSALRMFGRIEKVHPKRPHRHLPSVGVDPAMQAAGIGRRLMEEFDRRCDADGMTGYLETIRWSDPAKPSHERFYGSLGFEVTDVIPMTDAWEVLTMTRAVRQPRLQPSTLTDES